MIFTMKKKEYDEVLDDLFDEREKQCRGECYKDVVRTRDELPFDLVSTSVKEAYLEAVGAI